MASILPSLHRAAPRLTRRLFDSLPKQTPQWQLQARRAFKTVPARPAIAISNVSTVSSKTPSQSSSFARSFKAYRVKFLKAFFPRLTRKPVGYWLLFSAANVFGIVVFGGLTRLTESGLSITEWKPVTGALPPSGESEWEAEFQKYQSSPEFKLLNPNMTMDEFKKIYYMEWTHRLWGRFVGVTFVVPAVLFIVAGKVSKPMAGRILGIAGLIGLQGFLGWWMVSSGLKDHLFAPGSHPRVSQYRLVAHLGTAFLCYSAMFWNGLQILREQKLASNIEAARGTLERLKNPRLRVFQRSIAMLAGLVFITAMSGGFVAGLDAGLIYNDFPWMGQGWIPPLDELLSDFYSQKADGRDLWWRNALENPSLAQLDHRVLATTTFTAVIALFTYSRFSPTIVKLLPNASKRAVHGVLGFACLQVALGISTLLYLVPLPLASAHQAGSLALLSYVLLLGSRTWLPNKRFLQLLQKRKISPGSVANQRGGINSLHANRHVTAKN
ncbi:uncharacterized protein KY384_002598 [Bacidia gigantensis]|uniref:uncharacterized protein n=1 Tax=Bacidia gigantensis TaxID=2732470 RepID=UPI001D04333B|nr:uncharacterized protein KY384_002598 [Bacidia gigantensis]KAG8532721.1 hypothetical protein KY384_002598 [Bacidia gigantensis]